MAQYAQRCTKSERARHLECLERARAIVATGVCPDCGTKLVRNSSLAGWWQCGASASEAMRAPEFRGLPMCSFQVFTE